MDCVPVPVGSGRFLDLTPFLRASASTSSDTKVWWNEFGDTKNRLLACFGGVPRGQMIVAEGARRT